MFAQLRLLAFVFVGSALITPASAQLLERRDVSFEMAHAIARGAMSECRRRGFAVAVAVVDRAGETIIAMRDDDAGPHTMENARRKAYTARSFRITTEEFVRDMATRPVRREQTTLPNVIAITGGVPIKVGDEVIGGVGASGSPGQDEACVRAGLERVQQDLRPRR